MNAYIDGFVLSRDSFDLTETVQPEADTPAPGAVDVEVETMSETADPHASASAEPVAETHAAETAAPIAAVDDLKAPLPADPETLLREFNASRDQVASLRTKSAEIGEDARRAAEEAARLAAEAESVGEVYRLTFQRYTSMIEAMSVNPPADQREVSARVAMAMALLDEVNAPVQSGVDSVACSKAILASIQRGLTTPLPNESPALRRLSALSA